MPIPSKMSDISAVAGSNSPAGTDAIGNSLDDYVRAFQSVLRLEQSQAASTVASASTVDLSLVNEKLVQVTGTVTINSFGTQSSGISKFVRFTGILTVTNSAAIVTHTGANITTAVGDIMHVVSDGGGNWRVLGYSRPIITSANVTTALGYTPVNKAGDTFTGQVNVAYATPVLNLNKTSGSAGTNAYIAGQTGGLDRWVQILGNGTNESGSSAGSDYYLARYNDAGAFVGIVMTAIRSTGNVTFEAELTMQGTQLVGYRGMPQNAQSAAYTLVLADSGKTIYHPAADTTARIWTIPANSSVAYPIGTLINFDNEFGAGVITIAITTDTLVQDTTGSTGSRTLAAGGTATARKVTATRWRINGTGLT